MYIHMMADRGDEDAVDVAADVETYAFEVYSVLLLSKIYESVEEKKYHKYVIKQNKSDKKIFETELSLIVLYGVCCMLCT